MRQIVHIIAAILDLCEPSELFYCIFYLYDKILYLMMKGFITNVGLNKVYLPDGLIMDLVLIIQPDNER